MKSQTGITIKQNGNRIEVFSDKWTESKSRYDLIQDLERVNDNVKTYIRELTQTREDNPFYKVFSSSGEWEHRQEIKRKCLAFWKRKFNRILNQLKYA